MMLFTQSAASAKAMLEIIQGAPIASGNAGTNAGGSPNFQDLTAGAFADVLVGDNVYISGIATPFVVLTKTDSNNLIFTTNITPVHAANAVWKATRGGVGEANVKFGGPYLDNSGANRWIVIYDSATFAV